MQQFLDPTIGKEAPILFLVLSFFIIFGYIAVRLAGKAIEFIKARDAAFLASLEKLSADLQREQTMRDEMWRGFVKDQWTMMSKSLDSVAEQIANLGAKMDQHDRRTSQHEKK